MVNLEFLIIIIIAIFIAFIFIGHKNNVADWGNFFVNVIDGWIRVYTRHFHHFIYQPIPVSNNKATLLASNHLTGLDPFLIVAACRKPIRFMITKEEYERFGLQWLFRAVGCIPVARSGRVDIAFNTTLDRLKKGDDVLLFPEGGINDSKQTLQKLKVGIIKLAKMAELPITSLRVSGMRSRGHTLPAFILPSQSRLIVLPELDCGNLPDKEALVQLAEHLSGKR